MHEKKITTDTQSIGSRTRVVVFVLFGLLITQVSFYGYLVNASVEHVVSRIALERKTGDLVSTVSKLESEYFTLQNGVTTEKAKSLEYTTTSAVQYVDSNGATVTVLTRSN